MIAEGVDRLIALPMFPQYSATTTASATDVPLRRADEGTPRAGGARRAAVLRSTRLTSTQSKRSSAMTSPRLPWEPEHIVISFHGMPQKYAQQRRPYATHVVRTTQALVKRMGWKRDYWTQTYQSRFGRSEWLKPYTDDVLTDLAKKGVKRVYVALPGFTADCLETLDEIGNESREVFVHAGGEHLKTGTCLNDHPKWIEAMARIIRDEGHGWLT